MDSHDVGGFSRGGVKAALSSITCPTVIVAIDSDILYPLSEQLVLAECIPNVYLKIINSSEGHDGFLLEQQQVGRIIRDFLAEASS